MTHSQSIRRVHTELSDKYAKQRPVLSSWRGFLNVHYEIASENKNYDMASYINELIRFDIQEPGPHTEQELNELLTY